MVNVTARKIRDVADPTSRPRVFEGFLVNYPAIGRGMIIFRNPHGHRMITTPVRRVLSEEGSRHLFVETVNSVYRIEIHGEPLMPMIDAVTDAA